MQSPPEQSDYSFDLISKRVRSLAHASGAALYWWHETRRALVTLEINPASAAAVLEEDAVPEFAAASCRTRSPVLATADELPQHSDQPKALLPVIAVPVVRGGQCAGVLAVYHRVAKPVEHHEYTALLNLAEEVGARTPHLKESLAVRLREIDLTSTMRALRKVQAAHAPKEIWNIVARTALRLTGADIAWTLCADKFGADVTAQILRGAQERSRKTNVHTRRSELDAILDKRLYQTKDECAQALTSLAAGDNVGSALAVPIGERSNRLGAIVVAWTEQEQVDNDRIHLAEGWATCVAGTLESKRLTVGGGDGRMTAAFRSEIPLQYLLKITRVLNLSSGARDLPVIAARLAVPDLADLCVIDLIDSQDNLLPASGVAVKDRSQLTWTQGLTASARPYACSPNGLPRVLASQGREKHDNIDEELATASAQDQPGLRLLRGLGLRSSLTLAMKGLGRNVGVMTLGSSKPRYYSGTRVLMAEDLAVRTAQVLQLSRAYERERNVATELQTALLPALSTSIDGVDLDRLYVPAKGEAQIGGDWYDTFIIAPKVLGVSIGDVAGHGLQSAVQMNIVRQAIRTAAVSGLSVGAVFERADLVLGLDVRHVLVTAIYGTIDLNTWRFTYAIAGHPPPILINESGALRYLPISDPPLGSGGHHWQTHDVPLAHGETIVLYTDGLIEFNHNIEEGEERLRGALEELVASRRLVSARSVYARTLDGEEPRDDVALLILRVNVDPLSMRVPAIATNCALLRSELRTFLERCPLDEEQRYNLLVAAGEAVSNAMEHPQEREDESVQLKAWVEKGSVTVSVSDSGRWKTPEIGLRGRGRGIPIIHALVKESKIWSDPRGTFVELRELCRAN